MRETNSGQRVSVSQTEIGGSRSFVNHARSGSSCQSTNFHLVFYDSSYRQAENQLQELLLINASLQFLTWDINHLEGEFGDFLNSFDAVNSSTGENLIASIWFLPGENMLQWIDESENELRILSHHLAQEAEIYAFETEQLTIAETIAQQFDRPVFTDYRQPAKTQFEHMLFIDENLPGYQIVAQEIIQELDVEIVLLDPNRDGLEQIREALTGQEHLEAIHLLASGEPGRINLGNSEISAKTLRGENSGAIEAIRAVLKNDGEIRIYGCRFNDGEAGQEATRLLSGMTGSFVIVDYRKTEPTTWDQPLNAPEEEVEDLSLLASAQWSEPLPKTYFEDLNLSEVSPFEPCLQSKRQHQTVAADRVGWLGPASPRLKTTHWQHVTGQPGLDWSQIIAGVLVGVAIGFCGYWAMSSWGLM